MSKCLRKWDTFGLILLRDYNAFGLILPKLSKIGLALQFLQIDQL